MVSCSSSPKIEYIEPNKFIFVVPKINITETEDIKVTDLNVNDTNITTSVNSFLRIRSQCRRRRIEKEVWKEGFKSLVLQIERYNKTTKEKLWKSE